MSGADDPKHFPPALAKKADGAVLFDRAEIAGRTITGETFVEVSANRAVIADTLFRECVFTDCSFRTADFEAVIFEDCRFVRSDFSTADFRSSEFARCRIESCNFSAGAVKASRFTDSVVQGGKFGCQALDDNIWINCDLIDVSFRRATLLHMSFERCRFVATQFADCISLYHFFKACHFQKCRMNADSVALSFGLTRENIAELTLVWQGLKQRAPRKVEALLEHLLRAVTDRNWGIATASLAANFGLLETRNAMHLAFGSIDEAIVANRRIRKGEVRFLSQLTAHLAEANALPFLAIVEGLDLCGRAETFESYRGDESLRALAFSLKEAELDALRAWEETREALSTGSDRLASVEFVFANQPTSELLQVLEELAIGMDKRTTPPRRISTRSGSYIEIVSMTLGTLMALVIALGMLVRIVDGLIAIRARMAVLMTPPAAIECSHPRTSAFYPPCLRHSCEK